MGRNNVINSADRITRKVNSIYPAISEYRTNMAIERYHLLTNDCLKFLDFKLKNNNFIENFRLRAESGLDLFRNIIEILKNHQIGNCYEKARLAEIIGKINGEENIYTAKIFLSRNKSRLPLALGHVVSIIKKGKLEKNILYPFKHSDSIVIDPTLSITDYSDNYIQRLKNEFHGLFMYIPDNEFMSKKIAKESNSINEYKHKMKSECFKPEFNFKLHDDEILSIENANILRNEYPELIIQ